MSKLEYTTEDFVLDPEFRNWVLSPDETTKAYWEDYLEKNPSKLPDIKLARTLLLNIARKRFSPSEARIESGWKSIERTVQELDKDNQERKVIPLNSYSTIKRHESESRSFIKNHQFYRVAGIIIIAFSLSLLINLFLQPHEQVQIQEAPIVYESQMVPPGVKSSLTLPDGSKVTLNSGSSLKYIKNFEKDQRKLELLGEAYFEVTKDSLRPFLVNTGPVTTRVLGTSFNIKAYENEPLDISLLKGMVEIDLKFGQKEKISLVPGESLNINLDRRKFQKQEFDEEKLLAWTKKTIIFDQTPISEIKRVLENWYGVRISFLNLPNKKLKVSGIFVDQTLENVLNGLSYSARFEYQIDQDRVYLTFL